MNLEIKKQGNKKVARVNRKIMRRTHLGWMTASLILFGGAISIQPILGYAEETTIATSESSTISSESQEAMSSESTQGIAQSETSLETTEGTTSSVDVTPESSETTPEPTSSVENSVEIPLQATTSSSASLTSTLTPFITNGVTDLTLKGKEIKVELEKLAHTSADEKAAVLKSIDDKLASGLAEIQLATTENEILTIVEKYSAEMDQILTDEKLEHAKTTAANEMIKLNEELIAIVSELTNLPEARLANIKNIMNEYLDDYLMELDTLKTQEEIDDLFLEYGYVIQLNRSIIIFTDSVNGIANSAYSEIDQLTNLSSQQKETAKNEIMALLLNAEDGVYTVPDDEAEAQLLKDFEADIANLIKKYQNLNEQSKVTSVKPVPTNNKVPANQTLVTSKQTASIVSNKKELPKTGEVGQSMFDLLGSIFISISLIYIIVNRKKDLL